MSLAYGDAGYGQRDPLTEYKLEGYELFKESLARIRRNVIYNVYCFTPARLTPQEAEEALAKNEKAVAEASK
jgi:preprotein translocase subunit SecA